MFNKFQSIIGEELQSVRFDEGTIKLETLAGWCLMLYGTDLMDIETSGNLTGSTVYTVSFIAHKDGHQVKISTSSGHIKGVWKEFDGIF